jgi:ferredoxin
LAYYNEWKKIRMPKVKFQPSGRTIEVPDGTTLFQAAKRAGLPVAASCDEVFVCGKCNLEIVEGADHLSKQTSKERDLLQAQGRALTDRVSCVTLVLGDCTVRASYW